MLGSYNVTLNQIAYGLHEIIEKEISDDSGISLSQIKDMVHDIRSVLLKQKFDSNTRIIDDNLVQHLDSAKLKIEKVDSSIAPIPSGKYIYRTQLTIPPTIDCKNSEGSFTRIGPSDILSRPYTLTTYDRALFSGNGRFNKDSVFCFLRDGKIYLISNTGLYHRGVQYIAVSGVFQNPYEVAIFNGNSLTFDDMKYPVSRSLRRDIENIILKEKLGLKANSPTDKVNDGNDSTAK